MRHLKADAPDLLNAPVPHAAPLYAGENRRDYHVSQLLKRDRLGESRSDSAGEQCGDVHKAIAEECRQEGYQILAEEAPSLAVTIVSCLDCEYCVLRM